MTEHLKKAKTPVRISIASIIGWLCLLCVSVGFAWWTLALISNGETMMGKRDTPIGFYFVASLVCIAYTASMMFRDIAFSLLKPSSPWRTDIWDVLLGKVKEK